MKVNRIVTNIATAEGEKARAFYQDLLGLDVLMDFGWITTYGSNARMTVQISVMSEGGSGTPVPDISIEVDDVGVTVDERLEQQIERHVDHPVALHCARHEGERRWSG